MDLQPSGFLKVLINGWSIRFSLRIVDGDPVVHEYVGRLRHPDLLLPLAEIRPESEQELDDLYSREKITFVGCDLVAAYVGLSGALG